MAPSAKSGGEQLVAQVGPARGHRIQQIADGVERAVALAHLAAVDQQVAAVHPEAREAPPRRRDRRPARAPWCPARRRSARSRTRGGERRCPRRRCGCRWSRPGRPLAIAEHSMCQPGKPRIDPRIEARGQQAAARRGVVVAGGQSCAPSADPTASGAWRRPSTGQSRAGHAFLRAPRPARPTPVRRAPCPTAPVLRERRDGVVDLALAVDVGVIALDQALDQRQHLGDEARRARMQRRSSASAPQ